MDKKTTKQPRRLRTALVALTVAVSGVGVGGYALASGMTQPETVETVETVGKFAPTPVETVEPTPIETPTQAPAPEPAPVVQAPAPPHPAPIQCPPGSTSNSNDGTNDTSCYPDVCFSIVVPDPAHPECDAPFKP